ncbi:MAG: indolepyruvate oxidoreductase subunit beta [Verrucomicrobia bacterium]|nr:indolepyruvate oxidoreductase subunit beta [Verrucomicrobiota bacterium]MBU1910469.1 indolepyruvate oxidoreductase subunit beta [Verrucomicrobiota bacterium]
MNPESSITHQDILIAGVGGQGILTIAGIIGTAAIERGLHVKQSEVHGMAQRGGAVVSHLRLSERPIASDLISRGRAHLLLAMEPMEGLRHLPFLRHDGVLVANSVPMRNLKTYPATEKLIAHIDRWQKRRLLDAEALARKAGTVRAVNSVLLGAASPFLMIPAEVIRDAVAGFFDYKGADVVEKNLLAFDLGRAASLEEQKGG